MKGSRHFSPNIHRGQTQRQVAESFGGGRKSVTLQAREKVPFGRGHFELVPTFQSSYNISATTFYELWKAMGTSKSMTLVPLFDLKSLGLFRRLQCRDFKSAALGNITSRQGNPF